MALKGIKVIEMMGLAPGPLCGTFLADFGASVTVVQKINPNPFEVMINGKKTISVNLKDPEGLKVVEKLCSNSDVLIDTYRPGVMEKLGLGPDVLLKRNSRLVYARLTGYGQEGQYKNKAGHDINYIGMTGILSLLSKNREPPSPPLNLASDFAGGSLVCAFGIVMALLERTKSGKGQVIDASMTQGAAYVGTWLYKSRNLPIWIGEPGTNMLDGGLPSYMTYKTKDGKFMAVGALEPEFYANFLKGLELNKADYPQITSDLDVQKKKFEELFLRKTQAEWCEIFDKLDACVTPVLNLNEVDKHKYRSSDNTFYRDTDGLVVPEPAPRLSDTPGVSTGKLSSPEPGQHTVEILKELGYKKLEIESLIKNGSVYALLKSNL